MSTLYAINTSHGRLSLRNGYLQIPVGGFLKVTEEESKEHDFVFAERRGWLKYSKTEPTVSEVPAVKAIEFFEPNQGMSEDELKVELAARKEASNPVAKTEALGQGETIVTEEATTTKLGEDQEPEKKGRSKKTAE